MIRRRLCIFGSQAVATGVHGKDHGPIRDCASIARGSESTADPACTCVNEPRGCDDAPLFSNYRRVFRSDHAAQLTILIGYHPRRSERASEFGNWILMGEVR